MTTDKSKAFEEAYEGKIDAVKARIAEDKSIVLSEDTNGRLLLHWAALGGHNELVQLLLQLNSPVNACDDISMTPLILAASAGRLPVVHTLMSKGANVNAKNDEGHSALQYACSKGWKEIVEILLNNDADVNIADKRGARPLHRAASLGIISIVQLLLNAKNIDIDARDIYCNTPLHLCCEENRTEVAEILIRNGAQLDVMNKEQQTPLDLADYLLRRRLLSIAENN